MFAGAAINLMYMIILACLAMISAFFLPPEIPALLSVLIYPFLLYHIANSAGDNFGDYKAPITVLLQTLLWIILVFAVIYWRNGLIISGELKDVSFFAATYFSITTWTTLGYGDFAPPPRIRHITSIEALLGYTGMGIWIAIVGLWVAQRTQNRKEIHEHNSGLVDSADDGIKKVNLDNDPAENANDSHK